MEDKKHPARPYRVSKQFKHLCSDAGNFSFRQHIKNLAAKLTSVDLKTSGTKFQSNPP